MLLKALKQYKQKDRIPMAEKNINNIIENAMEEKYKFDSSKHWTWAMPITCVPIETDKMESFPKFTFDYLIMHYGLKTIALKNLGSIQMVSCRVIILLIGA